MRKSQVEAKKKIKLLITSIVFTSFVMIVAGIVGNTGSFMNADEVNNTASPYAFVAAEATGSASFSSGESSTNITKTVNDTFDVESHLNTGGQSIIGFTFRVTYDPAYLTIVNNTDNKPMSWSNQIAGMESENTVDSGNIIRYGQFVFSGYNGSANAGSIKFRAIKSGSTFLRYYKPGADFTAAGDCDLVVSGGGDILNTATDLSISINDIPQPVQQITSGPSVSGVGLNTAAVAWQTRYSGTSVVRYGTAPGSYSASASGASSTNHTVNLSGLASNTVYYFSADTTNNSYTPATVSATGQFRTQTPPPPPGQSITSGPVIANITTTEMTVNWATSQPGNSVVEYGATVSYGQNNTKNDSVTSHSVTLQGLTPSTTYHYRVLTVSSSGKVYSGDKTFRTITASTSGSSRGTTTYKPAPTVAPSPVDSEASTIQVDKTTAVADGSDEIKITLSIKDKKGKLITDRKPAINVNGSDNKLTDPTVKDNAWHTSLVSTKPEKKDITATLEGTTIGKTVSVTFTQPTSIWGKIKQNVQINRGWLLPIVYVTGGLIILLCLVLIVQIIRNSATPHTTQEYGSL